MAPIQVELECPIGEVVSDVDVEFPCYGDDYHCRLNDEGWPVRALGMMKQHNRIEDLLNKASVVYKKVARE